MKALIALLLLFALLLPMWAATRRMRDLPRDAARLRDADKAPPGD